MIWSRDEQNRTENRNQNRNHKKPDETAPPKTEPINNRTE